MTPFVPICFYKRHILWILECYREIVCVCILYVAVNFAWIYVERYTFNVVKHNYVYTIVK